MWRFCDFELLALMCPLLYLLKRAELFLCLCLPIFRLKFLDRPIPQFVFFSSSKLGRDPALRRFSLLSLRFLCLRLELIRGLGMRLGILARGRREC